MKQSLPKLVESFQQKVDRLEESLKSTCLSLGEPLAYAHLILHSVSRHLFHNKAEELRVKTELITEEINLLKRGQSFSQRMGALLAEREEMVRFLRAELIINRKVRQLNLRICCEKLEGIRLYTLTALQNLQSLVGRMKVHPSEYVSSILLKLVQSTDFLRFTALRRHIQFSNGDDPLFLVPLRKFQSLYLTGDYNKRSIISLFTLTEAYQLRLHLADRFLRGADVQQQQTPELKSLQLKAKRVSEFDFDEIISDQAARKGRKKHPNSTKTMHKLKLPGLPIKQDNMQLNPNQGIDNRIKMLINTKTAQREGQEQYFCRGRRAVTQADQYNEMGQLYNQSYFREGPGHGRPRRRVKTLDCSQGRDGDDQRTPLPRVNFKNVMNPHKAQGTLNQNYQRSTAQLPSRRQKRSVLNIPHFLSLSHHEQSSKLSSKKVKNQSSSKTVQDPKQQPKKIDEKNEYFVSKIKSKRRKKSTIKIIIEHSQKEIVPFEEGSSKQDIPEYNNTSLKWFRDHRESRRQDFSPQVNEKIYRLQQMAKKSQKYVATSNSLQDSSHKIDNKKIHSGNKEQESLKYKNPIDKINEIKKQKTYSVIDESRGVKSKGNHFKGQKEEVISEQVNSQPESTQRLPQNQHNNSLKKQQQNEKDTIQKIDFSNSRENQHQITLKDPELPINMNDKANSLNQNSIRNEQINRNVQSEQNSRVCKGESNPPFSSVSSEQRPAPQINESIIDNSKFITRSQNERVSTSNKQHQAQQLSQKSNQPPSPSIYSIQNPPQSVILPSKVVQGMTNFDDSKQVQLPNNTNRSLSDLNRHEQSSLPSNNRLIYPQQSNIFVNHQNHFESRHIQSSTKKQSRQVPSAPQLAFQSVARPSAQQQRNNTSNPNQHMSQYLNSKSNDVLYGYNFEIMPNNTYIYNPQATEINPKLQTDSTVKRAQLIQKCIFVSKSMEQSVMAKQLREFNKQAWRYLEGYLTTSYFKNRHIMMTTCIFKDEMAGYCLHYPYVGKHGRFVFILNIEVSQQFLQIQSQLIGTFLKYIFANDPTTKLILLRHKQLFHQNLTSALQGQPYYAGVIKTPIQSGQLADKSLLFERKQLKCSKDLEFSNIISCSMLYITPANKLQLSNPKFKDAYFSSNFLKRLQNSLKKHEGKKFLNYNQVASYLQQQRLPQFTKCRHDGEMLLFSQFFDDCLVNVRYFVYSKYFYFTIEPPYSFFFESQYVYYTLLSTSAERKYFILGDKIYEENQNIEFYQDFRANVLNKKISDLSKEDKRGTIVACPQFKKDVQLQFTGNGTGILSFGLNWKEYIKGVRYFSEEEVKVEMIGPFFCGLVEVDENNLITQVFSTLIGEGDLIK